MTASRKLKMDFQMGFFNVLLFNTNSEELVFQT